MGPGRQGLAPPRLPPSWPHSLSPSWSWGLRCLQPPRRKHDQPPSPAVLTPDTCLWGESKDGAPCWLVREQFCEQGLTGGGGWLRGEVLALLAWGSPCLQFPIPASPGDQPGLLWGRGDTCQLSEGHLASTQGSLQHGCLDSALPSAGLSSGNNYGCAPRFTAKMPTAAFSVNTGRAPTQRP